MAERTSYATDIRPLFTDRDIHAMSRAFNLAIDKVTYSKVKRITKPLTAFTPEGIFPGYPQPKGDAFDPERARQLLGQAGFPVTKNADGSYECKKFPVDQIEYTFNTASSNKTMAEYMQAQWKQNLGITVPLKSMEFKTFINAFMRLPCQIVRTSRRILYRLLSWNPWNGMFLRVLNQLRC